MSKKVILLSALCFLCCTTRLHAKKIQIGLNGSFLPHDMVKAGPGFLVGIEGETKQRHTITIRSGLYLSSRAGGAESKKVWGYPGILSLYDVHYSIVYLEVPIVGKYDWMVNGGVLEFILGPSLAFAVMNHSKATFRQALDDSYWLGKTDTIPEYDYLRMEDPPPDFLLNLSNSTIFWNVGIAYKLNRRYFEVRYSLGAINNADYIEMNDLIHAIHFILGFSQSK